MSTALTHWVFPPFSCAAFSRSNAISAGWLCCASPCSNVYWIGLRLGLGLGLAQPSAYWFGLGFGFGFGFGLADLVGVGVVQAKRGVLGEELPHSIRLSRSCR